MGLARPVQILGVNGVGYESANDSITAGRSLPWLQDTPEQGVWESWDPTYRDVIVLGPNGEDVTSYNLTDLDLSDAEHYAELRAFFVMATEL